MRIRLKHTETFVSISPNYSQATDIKMDGLPARKVDMIYFESIGGGLKADGCGSVTAFQAAVTLFGLGDQLYVERKARRGTLEKVVVKSIRRVTSRRTHGKTIAIYQDTFNALWNEYDLVTYEEALSLVGAFEVKYQADLNALNRD